jgi:hypothetical protein
VAVTAPALPSQQLPQYGRAISLSLQVREDTLYSEFQTVAIGIAGGETTTIGSLFQGKTYRFRYQAVGTGGATNGAEATQSVGVLSFSWQAGPAIQCEGIRWPLPGASVPVGGELALSSYLAIDWDELDLTVNGQTTSARRTDPCIYYWNTPDGGSFKSGINRGQSVAWIAPATPGAYTIELVIVDQDQGNKVAGEGGSRDDSSRGWWDDPLKFRITVQVTP